MYDKFPYKLTWKMEIPHKGKGNPKTKKYQEYAAWFPYEHTRENMIKRLKRDKAKFIRKSTNNSS